MSYCRECGSYCTINDLACNNCGYRFDRDENLGENKNGVQRRQGQTNDTEETHFKGEALPDDARIVGLGKKNKTDSPVDESLTNFSGGSLAEATNDGAFMRFNEESQLGKGLIKPNTKEVGIDGIHFKYEKPLNKFIKAEPISNKVMEYRAKNDESLGNRFLDNTFSQQIPGLIDNTQSQPTEEQLSENDTPLGNSSGDNSGYLIETEPVAGDPLVVETPPEGNEIKEYELGSELPEFVELPESLELELPEPELKSTSEYEVLWEGPQTICGFPLQNSYRISTHSILISNRRQGKFSEVDLVLMADVKLKQSWYDKIFGVGDILISVKDLPEPGLLLSKIRQPNAVFKLLQDLMRI